MKNKRKLFKMLDIVVGTATFFSLLLLLNTNSVFADSNAIDNVTLSIPISCSMAQTINSAHTTTINIGTYVNNIGETTFSVFCNDNNGFAVYAVGYSDNTYGNTTMKPSTIPANNGIVTGTATSGNTSNWAIKLTAVSGTHTPILATGYNTYHTVPYEYTKVVSYDSGTDITVGSSFKTTYAAYASQTQPADTYTGKVKFTVVHPANDSAPQETVYIQNLNSDLCTTTARTVQDNRDNHMYTIQRLNDGNCWMMENLDLGRTTLTTDLTSANTNLSITVPATTFNSWKKTTGSDTYVDGEFISLSGTDSTSGTAYGTLYNYYAASAGTVSGTSYNNDAEYDICPSGWRLPTGNENGDFYKLYSSGYNYNSLRAPISSGGAQYTLAGYFYGGEPTGAESSGRYWTSTVYSSTSFYGMHFYEGVVYPALWNYHYFARNKVGASIRCILKEQTTISKLVYMQDFKQLTTTQKNEVLASMDNNVTYELIDNRDNHTYQIAKLLDGNIWMAENLDLGRTTLTNDLTSANTNLYATVLASTFNSWKKTAGTGTNDAGEYANVSGTDSISGIAYGTLYNYYAASAGTITGNSNNNNAQYDICPAGWRLPTGGSSGEFQTIYSYYNSAALMRASIENSGAAFTFAGTFYAAGPGDQGSGGVYWSSTRLNDTNVYGLVTDTTGVHPTENFGRNFGYSIRCVVK